MRRQSTAAIEVPVRRAGASRAIFALACLAALVLVTTAGRAGEARAAEQACANGAIRQEQLAERLPDCRAFELVSPQAKNGTDLVPGTARVSADGNALAFVSHAVFAGALSGSENTYLSRRGSAEWGTKAIVPPLASSVGGANAPYFAFNRDLSKGVLYNQAPPSLAPGDTLGTRNFYLRDNATDSYGVLTPAPLTGVPAVPDFAGASEDLGAVFFRGNGAKYLADANPQSVYRADAQGLRIVSRLPNDEAVAAAPGAGFSGSGYTDRAVSSDGARVYFTTPNTNGLFAIGQLYLRVEDGSAPAHTVHVSAPDRPVLGPDPEGTRPAWFRFASRDGRVAFFTSCEKLTEGSTAEGTSPSCASPAKNDLYRFDAATGELTDLSVADPSGGRVLGVLGGSDDGRRLYFAAEGALAPGATAGQPNVYLWEEGQGIAHVATVGAGDANNWISPGSTSLYVFNDNKGSRVSSDGRYLAFSSRTQLTAFDNAGTNQLYLYDLASGQYRCASCNPAGGPASTDATLQNQSGATFNIAVSGNAWEKQNLSDAGQLFFETGEGLEQSDNNHRVDVYEYSAPLSAPKLISSGTSASDSHFVGASRDGGNVFFSTREQLVGWDTDPLVDFYDARSEGGMPEPPPSRAACQGSECLGAAAGTPAANEPATRALLGAPNRRARAKARAGCAALGRAANRSAQRARQLRRSAKKATSASRSHRLERKAKAESRRTTELRGRIVKCKGGQA